MQSDAMLNFIYEVTWFNIPAQSDAVFQKMMEDFMKPIVSTGM